MQTEPVSIAVTSGLATYSSSFWPPMTGVINRSSGRVSMVAWKM